MVKGTTKRVILIKSPDPRLFDEAIFIVKEDAFQPGITNDEVLRQAQQTANSFIRENRQVKTRKAFPPAFFTALGAGATALVWILSEMI